MSIDLIPFRETPYNLQFVFAGAMHEWSYNSTFGAGTRDWELRTPPSKTVHFTNRIILTSSTTMAFQLWENATMATQGSSALKMFNVNRVSSSTTKMKIFRNSTFTGTGTNIEDIQLVAGDAYVQKAPEIILKSDTIYLMRTINTGAVSSVVNFQFVWYEPSN
jgi:hypothetical protein